MTRVIKLPRQFTTSAIQTFSRQIVSGSGSPIAGQIDFDFEQLQFIDGAGLTVICNAIEWLNSHGVTVRFGSHRDDSSRPLRYLDDCGFFQRYLGEKLHQNATIRDTTLPFQPVEHAHVHSWLEYDFSRWMCAKLNVSHGSIGSLRAVIKDLFQNVVDHSTLRNGFIHVQHYPNVNEIGITVSDFGCGIPANVRLQCPHLDDGQAILTASTNGFSTRSIPTNMGVGLDNLIRNVTGNKGIVSIFSYKGVLQCYADSVGRTHRTPSNGQSAYPGTLIDIRLKTKYFVGDDEEEGDMTW